MATVIAIVTIIWLGIFAAGKFKVHERETGVAAPSPGAMAEIRRTASDRGIPERQAYSDWLAREQRKR